MHQYLYAYAYRYLPIDGPHDLWACRPTSRPTGRLTSIRFPDLHTYYSQLLQITYPCPSLSPYPIHCCLLLPTIPSHYGIYIYLPPNCLLACLLAWLTYWPTHPLESGLCDCRSGRPATCSARGASEPLCILRVCCFHVRLIYVGMLCQSRKQADILRLESDSSTGVSFAVKCRPPASLRTNMTVTHRTWYHDLFSPA